MGRDTGAICRLIAPEYIEKLGQERWSNLVLAINVFANKLFPNFLSLACNTILANNTTDNLSKISDQGAIGNICDTGNIRPIYTR
jgi:hypothetical protein